MGKFLRSIWALWRNRKLLQQFGELLRTQDGRATGEPLYCVQKKRRVYGMDSQWGEKYIWQYSECSEVSYETDERLVTELLFEEMEHIGEDEAEEMRGDIESQFESGEVEWKGVTYEKIYYAEYWETVTVHFTEEAADTYATQNAHNLGDHRVYVTSQYRCHDWIDLRKFLMEC